MKSKPRSGFERLLRVSSVEETRAKALAGQAQRQLRDAGHTRDRAEQNLQACDTARRHSTDGGILDLNRYLQLTELTQAAAQHLAVCDSEFVECRQQLEHALGELNRQSQRRQKTEQRHQERSDALRNLALGKLDAEAVDGWQNALRRPT